MAREMGKPVREGIAEAQKCATVCDFYAENAAALPRTRADRDRCAQELRHVQPARRRSCRHAVELPVLAGLPVRGARADGRQRGRPEARVERPRLRARDRRRIPPRRLPGEPVSRPDDRERPGRGGDRESAGPGGDPDRQRPRGPGRRAQGGRDVEEDRARAGRERPLPHPRGRRSRARRGRLHQGTADQQRARAASRPSASSRSRRSGAPSRISSSGR